MLNHKYKSLFTFGLACIVLAIFASRHMQDYYPTVCCDYPPAHVGYYHFAKHTWLMKGRRHD